MHEIENILLGNSYAAPPARILEALNDELAHRVPDGAPHSIYEELWHICFWQHITLQRIAGRGTHSPENLAEGFPTVLDMEKEYWEQLCDRFLREAAVAAAASRDTVRLDVVVPCPCPGEPEREMTIRDQLESLGAHNAYHLGRIVLLRQLLGAWPPPSGGFRW